MVWQKREAAKQANTLQFYSSQELFDAYKQGRIRGFFSSYRSEQAFVEVNQLQPVPVIGFAYPSLELYHYLGREFEPFMQRLSQMLQSADA
ncbi:MAG: hypothetical protein V7752_01405 [Halopseudomonas sp.]